MKRMSRTVGLRPASTSSAAGPCSASSARDFEQAHDHVGFERRPHARDIGLLAGRIHHHEEVIATICDHQVILDAARVVGEHGVALPTLLEADDIHGHEPLERLGRIRAARLQDDLPHVAHVEQARPGACVPMFPKHAHGILDRHLVARELDHLAAELKVQVVKRRALRPGIPGFVGSVVVMFAGAMRGAAAAVVLHFVSRQIVRGCLAAARAVTPACLVGHETPVTLGPGTRMRAPSGIHRTDLDPVPGTPPLSCRLRSLSRRRTRVGAPLSRVLDATAVPEPESFRGGCSFGTGIWPVLPS